ncbi:LysR family transcriptional regulator [Nonomuraea sp. NPDC050310]|uniref:LysR family transcriptional regulator n=1 Tax=Nonomuraea sp. NPDC050310 TaxID=3154935 RepID=UPI0033EB442D
MLRELQCFVRVAEARSFSRAAADLGLSQPAVSQAVTRLEKATRLRLLERNARAVRLTPQGRTLLEHALQVLAAMDSFEAEAERLARPVIHLAYPPLAGPLAARAARRLAGRTPPVTVELRLAGRAAAAAALEAGEVSAALMAVPAPAGFVTGARFHVALDRLARPAHPGRGARDVLLVPRNRPVGGAWAAVAARWGGRHRVVADDLDDFAAALDLVAAGAGVLPVPQLLTRTIRRDDVEFVPLDPPDLRLTYGLAWSADRPAAELMALVQAVQDSLWTR